MNNFIGRKPTSILMKFNSHHKNSIFNNKRTSLNNNKNEEIYEITKKNTISFNNQKNHRLFFSNLLKQRNLLKKSLKREIKKDRIIELLSKDEHLRTSIENKEIGIYLTKKFDFFKKIKEEYGQSKLDRIINICQFKKYINDDIIVNYEEKENKIFILLEGNLILYKPIFVEKSIPLIEFLNMLNKIENKENDYSKYFRIKEKNIENGLDISFYEQMSNNEGVMNQYFDFYIEDYEKVGKYSEGEIFGANINDTKVKISDILIKSEKESFLIYYDIDEYNKISKTYEGKKFKKEIEKFRNDFPFFKHFSDNKIVDIFKILSNKTIYRDEYLYKQNDKDDKIYFIIKGKFEMYSSFSFDWLINFLDYIKDSKTNIIYHLIKKFPKNKEEYNELLEEIKTITIKSPMTEENISNMDKIIEKENEKYIYGVKNEEENINNSNKLFKVKIKDIKAGEMLGLEDSIEFKNRYCSVKCISEIGEVKYISIFDLIKLIKIYNNEKNYMNKYLLDFISKTKFMLYHQIIKDVQNLENQLTFKFETKYNELIKPEQEKKSINEKNLSIAAIKVKGFKYDIKEVFDNNIPIFPLYKKSNSYNNFLKNQLLLKNLLGSPKKYNKRLVKYRQKKSKPLLSLSDPNIFNKNDLEHSHKILSSFSSKKMNLLTEKVKTHILKNKKDISLSTNFSNNINTKLNNYNQSKDKTILKLSSKNGAIKNYINFTYNEKEENSNNILYQQFNYNKSKKTNNFFYSPLSGNNKESRNNKIIGSHLEERKFFESQKNINKEFIESILLKKFGYTNKKYCLGNEFKKKLDKEKKKFNLIHYKEYYNK